MGKSRGMRRKSRKALTKRVREKGKLPLSKLLTDYSVGDKVVINIDSGIHNGMPHKRYQGKVGTILEKRGKGLVVEIPEGNTSKVLMTLPPHINKHKEI
jgi:large subunit ribosomal protein L21e